MSKGSVKFKACYFVWPCPEGGPAKLEAMLSPSYSTYKEALEVAQHYHHAMIIKKCGAAFGGEIPV